MPRWCIYLLNTCFEGLNLVIKSKCQNSTCFVLKVVVTISKANGLSKQCSLQIVDVLGEWNAFLKKVKCPAMDKQKKNDMFCCQTSNTISQSQKCSPQCSKNRGSKKSIRPYLPSKTGSLPLILRLRDGYQLCFFQLLLHLFQLLDCCPNPSTPTEGIYRCPLPEKKKKQTLCISYTHIYTHILSII